MKTRYRVMMAMATLALLAAPAFASDKETEMAEKKWDAVRDNGRIVVQADVPEVESNNSLATAQLLGCGNTLRPANISAVLDTDYVSFTANAGDILTIGTDADGATPVGDTRIRLFNNNGATLATDDDSGPVLYSLISNFVAPYTGLYYVGIANFDVQTGTYKAFITCVTPQPPPANDQCGGAIAIACGAVSLTGDTQSALNDYTLPPNPNTCTNFSAAGRDVVYKFNASAGDDINLTYTSTADASIYLITNCADPIGSCVAGADVTLSGQPEVLTYTFTSAGTYFLILDSFGTNTSGTWTLAGNYNCPSVPSRRSSWGRLKTIYR